MPASHRPEPPSVLITGASGGLGEALAIAYAAPGVRLFLGARRSADLERVADRCRKTGAEVDPRVVDVTDRQAMATWIEASDDARPLTLVIANAGVSAGTSRLNGGAENRAQIDTLFDINVNGVFNTVLPVLPRFRARRSGQIALMSSMAAFRGMPGAPTYCATKAAVRLWGEGMRTLLEPEGIGVTVICPGFVRKPMTAVNRFRMPFLMDADAAARRIRHGLARNRGRISFPAPLALGTWFLAALPDAVSGAISAITPRK